tara:strand:- start:1299 stop:1430 length:132 start_codon:yes stop_codon:yes gene_type:complete
LHTFDNFPEANAKDARILHPHIFTAELESCLNELGFFKGQFLF